MTRAISARPGCQPSLQLVLTALSFYNLNTEILGFVPPFEFCSNYHQEQVGLIDRKPWEEVQR